jgi:predicted acyltransferase
LDAFRGATVAAMLLVNNPGTSPVWWPLEHAEWHGWTPTDLIFPFFLFIVGITTELSRKDPRQILRRGALIVLFGLLLNWFPFYWWGKMPDPTFLERVAWRIDHIRFLGVLQRIGIVYIVAALISLRASRRTILVLAAAILLGYWALLTRAPLEPPAATLAARVDRAVLGMKHIWSISETWDPEGPLSTIPAVATALLGIAAAPWVRARNVRMLTIAGFAALAVGWGWGRVFPINKNLWTSSYVVFTAGFACVLLALSIWIIDIRGAKKWATPFVVFGVNPLVAFVGSGLMARLLSLIKIGGVSLQVLSYRTFLKPYFADEFGSFLWALSFVLVWLAILWVMYRRGIVLKV